MSLIIESVVVSTVLHLYQYSNAMRKYKVLNLESQKFKNGVRLVEMF